MTIPAALRAFILVMVAAFVAGCGHTNRLASYPVAGGRYLYRSMVSADAPQAHTSIPAADTNLAAGALSAISEGMFGGQLQSRLERVPARDLAAGVSRGVEDAMKTYLNAMQV